MRKLRPKEGKVNSLLLEKNVFLTLGSGHDFNCSQLNLFSIKIPKIIQAQFTLDGIPPPFLKNPRQIPHTRYDVNLVMLFLKEREFVSLQKISLILSIKWKRSPDAMITLKSCEWVVLPSNHI